jgi:hypothetical protein
MSRVRPLLNRLSCSNETVRNAPNMSLGSNGVDRVRSLRKVPTRLCLANVCDNGTSSASFASTFMLYRNGPKRPKTCDEDIATNDTSTPTPVSTSATPLGPITRAHARRHQVSSLLSSGSSYLENGDTCTLFLLRNNGLDQKGRGIAQAGFGL